jgi:hypothetical protein
MSINAKYFTFCVIERFFSCGFFNMLHSFVQLMSSCVFSCLHSLCNLVGNSFDEFIFLLWHIQIVGGFVSALVQVWSGFAVVAGGVAGGVACRVLGGDNLILN